MKKLLIFAIFLSFSALFAGAAVIGIDFGSEFFKISLISPGKSFVIIENTTSKRKTPTSIAFVNGERVYEADAVSKRSRNPQNTFVFLQKYLGALANDVKTLELARQNFEDYLFDLDPERGTMLFELKDFSLHEDQKDEKVTLTIEEITAMILRRAKVLAQKQGNIEIKDCVITVPSDFQASQRRALLDSAELAGLHVLGFINENTAAALYYGIERLDNETHTVIFYNLGSSSLKVSLVEYKSANSSEKSYKKPVETVKVLADFTETGVSGLSFDHVLAQHFAEVFDASPSRQHKTSLRNSVSAMIKLLRECNRLKEVLSANKESQFFVENLLDGEDFKSFIERRVFEEKSRELFAKLVEPIEYVLRKANRTLESVQRLEILGGAVRIPRVQQILNEFLQKDAEAKVELGAHLNGDEAMAFGAAFHAANLSHSFKVRPVHLYDGNDFEIYLQINELEDESSEELHSNEKETQENSEVAGNSGETPGKPGKYAKKTLLFPYKQRFGSKKTVSLTQDRNLKLQLLKREDNGQETLLCSFNLTNVSEVAKNEKFTGMGKPKVHMQFVLSSTWPTIDLEFAEASFDEVKYVEIEEFSRNNKKKNDSNETISNNNTQNLENETANETVDSNTTAETAEKKQKKKVIQHFFPLKIEAKQEGLQGLSSAQMEKSRKKLLEFDKHEEFLHKNSEAKNKLESYLYKVRDLLSEDDFKAHASPIETDELSSQMNENDEWLYSEEAFVSNYTEFNRRFHKMFAIASDIQHRLDETRKRPAAIESALTKLKEFEKKVNEINKTMTWINETHKNPALLMIENLRSWIEEKTAAQNNKPLYEDPVFTVGALEFRVKDVKEAYLNLKNIKKPKEKKKIEKEEKNPEKEKNEENEERSEENSEKREENTEQPDENTEKHEHDKDLEEKNPEKEQISEREDL